MLGACRAGLEALRVAGFGISIAGANAGSGTDTGLQPAPRSEPFRQSWSKCRTRSSFKANDDIH